MFGKKAAKPKRDHTGKNLSQYGLFEIPTDLNFDGAADDGDEEGDSDLEAELQALSAGGGKPKPPPRKVVPQANLDSMVADSLRDIPSDEELSGDDDDPDLLNELSQIAGEDQSSPVKEASPVNVEVPPSVDTSKMLSDRLKVYEQAEKNAKEVGETSRARRFGRGIKTLKDLIKQANAGRPINPEDIPPEVSATAHAPKSAEPTPESPQTPPEAPPEPSQVVRPAPPIPVAEEEKENVTVDAPTVNENTEALTVLKERQMQYKIAALKAKKEGDPATALNYLKVAKQFESVINAVIGGQPVDLSRMPGPPSAPQPKIEKSESQQHNVPEIQIPENLGDIPSAELIGASSVGEALEQRLDVYQKQEAAAKEQGNTSKARRMGRIVKQFEQAIKLHKAGKPVPIEDLPTPPGYAPIPVPGAAAPTAQPKPPPSPRPTPKSDDTPSSSRTKTSDLPSPTQPQSTRLSGNRVPNSRAEKQVVILLAKQKQFKEAALNAKKKGEINEAKELLRTAKGFDSLIEAARCGLPVDFSSIPISPDAKSQLDQEYDVVMAEECTEGDAGDLDVISRLEAQLTKQLKMSLTTRDHHKALGDVAGSNRFERLALNVTKDLDVVRLAHRTQGARVPKFHYENKDFSVVKSFTELGDNDLELCILRGINYNTTAPKEIDTYVKFEFPYPQETPYIDRTSTVKDTNNPDYNATFTIPIQRTVRACQRVFKRHSVKVEVYSKGCWCASDIFCCFSGFFRSDTLLGTATIKLQQLETQCEIHDSFDLLEGRKKVGGKVEVRLRLRNPIVTQEVEQLHEKWLVIDQ